MTFDLLSARFYDKCGVTMNIAAQASIQCFMGNNVLADAAEKISCSKYSHGNIVMTGIPALLISHISVKVLLYSVDTEKNH